MPIVDESKLLVSYAYLKVLWGDLKLTRLIKAENPKDLLACIDRLTVAIDTVQNELIGFFGYSLDTAPSNVATYVMGILPLFLEYRLNPHAALKEEIDKLSAAMEVVKKTEITANLSPQFSMFVV